MRAALMWLRILSLVSFMDIRNLLIGGSRLAAQCDISVYKQ
jgi:hypothetical protein